MEKETRRIPYNLKVAPPAQVADYVCRHHLSWWRPKPGTGAAVLGEHLVVRGASRQLDRAEEVLETILEAHLGKPPLSR